LERPVATLKNEVANHLQIAKAYVLKGPQVRELMAISGKPDTGPPPSRQPVKRIAIRDLFEGGREAVLLHDGSEYRLRLTSNGKLILTK
jgi:hemin uptake protein HemP